MAVLVLNAADMATLRGVDRLVTMRCMMSLARMGPQCAAMMVNKVLDTGAQGRGRGDQSDMGLFRVMTPVARVSSRVRDRDTPSTAADAAPAPPASLNVGKPECEYESRTSMYSVWTLPRWYSRSAIRFSGSPLCASLLGRGGREALM